MDDAASLRQEVAELEQNRWQLAAAYATQRMPAESAGFGQVTSGILQTICETAGLECGVLWSVGLHARAFGAKRSVARGGPDNLRRGWA